MPDVTPEVLNEINRETTVHHVLETAVVNGVDNGETIHQDSLLRIDEKRYSLLRKIPCISVYILRFNKRKIW